MFIHFKDINVSERSSWNNKAILTFDIDWASDEVLNYLLDILEGTAVKCCFFVTHDTAVLERIRKNKNFELGLHPNFNPLLNNNSERSADQILSDLKNIVPEAGVLRSHSLTTSGAWLSLYKKHGVKYLSNYMMNGVSDIQPFYQVNGLAEVPVYFADDGEIFLNDNTEIPRLRTRPEETKFNGIRVFNFHPIHIALNTSSFKQYEAAKPFQKDFKALQGFRNNSHGSETFLKQLLQHGK